MFVAERKAVLLPASTTRVGSSRANSPTSSGSPRTASVATCAISPPPDTASASTAAPFPSLARWSTTAPAPASSRRASDGSPARAAQLIKPGDRVILDGGTTTLAVARALPPDLPATVITHSPTIAAALIDHPTIEILLLGGRIYKHSAVACGVATAEAARAITADLFLLGVTGVHRDHGLTTGDAEEAAMKRTLAGRAADTYVLASSEKIGAVSPYKVLELDAITAILTDARGDALDALRHAGPSLIECD